MIRSGLLTWIIAFVTFVVALVSLSYKYYILGGVFLLVCIISFAITVRRIIKGWEE